MNSDVAARLIAAGMSQGEAWKKSDLFAKAERELSATGGGEAMCWFVPGRIEVLGKHTDYAGGRSLLCTAERGFVVEGICRSCRAPAGAQLSAAIARRRHRDGQRLAFRRRDEQLERAGGRHVRRAERGESARRVRGVLRQHHHRGGSGRLLRLHRKWADVQVAQG